MILGFKTKKDLRNELKEAYNLIDVLMRSNDSYANKIHKYHESVTDYLDKDRGSKKQLREYSEAIYNNLVHEQQEITRDK